MRGMANGWTTASLERRDHHIGDAKRYREVLYEAVAPRGLRSFGERLKARKI
jgi:hypothetical protein